MSASRKDQRHRVREIALQILYQREICRTDVGSAADTYFDLQWPDQQPPAFELRHGATELAHDTVRRVEAADALIAETAERWRPERMAILDRLIMRMAVAELLKQATPEAADGTSPSDVRPTAAGGAAPPAVVINEALELARTFSSEDSVKFINGMLDAIRKKLEL
jgi:N utilization substance protein B